MKLVKMSLAAAVLLGASAFAIDNVKVSGDVKAYYSTNDADTVNPITGANSNDLFDKTNSAADAALRLGVTGELMKNLSFGATGYAVSTLGLEHSLVRSTWTGAHDVNVGGEYADVKNNIWLGEAWLAYTMNKTTAKVGRMELDTPLAFSEKWSIVPNTFEAAVLINQDIPDTTLVGAYVSKGNGTNAVHLNNVSTLAGAGLALDGGVVGADAKFKTFAHDGAYAVAAINNSLKFLTAQAWYYNVVDVADAYWLQADWDCQLIKNVKVGAQYADIATKGLLAAAPDSSAYAFKLGYEGVENLKISAAYSKADNDGVLKIANVATNNLSGAQSKLYTEAWWNYGYVGAPGAESVNVTAEYEIKDIVKLGAYCTDVSNDIAGSTKEMTEVTLTASKSFGPLDTSVAYVSTDAKDQNAGSQYNTVQAYLTLNF